MSTKSPFEFEFTKIIMQSKGWCEMFVLKHSGIQQNIIMGSMQIFSYLFNAISQ